MGLQEGLRGENLEGNILQFLDQNDHAKAAGINIGETRATLPLAVIADNCNDISVSVIDRNWLVYRLDISRAVDSQEGRNEGVIILVFLYSSLNHDNQFLIGWSGPAEELR